MRSGRRDVHMFCDLESSFRLSWCDQEATVRPVRPCESWERGGEGWLRPMGYSSFNYSGGVQTLRAAI